MFVLLQDDLEVHYSGFKTNHIHNLSELVQENLGAQVRHIYICIPISISFFSFSFCIIRKTLQLQIINLVINFFAS